MVVHQIFLNILQLTAKYIQITKSIYNAAQPFLELIEEELHLLVTDIEAIINYIKEMLSHLNIERYLPNIM